MTWRHEHIETIKQRLKQKFEEVLEIGMSIEDCTMAVRDIIQEERLFLYEATNYTVYFKSFITYDDITVVRLNLINGYNGSEKLVSLVLDLNKEKETEIIKPIPVTIAKFLKSNLIGLFAFNRNDKEELQSIRTKIADLLSTLCSDETTYVLDNVYYEQGFEEEKFYLIVEFSRNCAGRPTEPFKISIDYQDTDIVNPDNLENTIKREPDFDPYCEESIRNLTIEQFIALINTIKSIKESLKWDTTMETIKES